MKQFYKNITLLITMLSVAVTDMAPYLYSVALPNIADYFHIQANTAQLAMTYSLIGFAISGLIYGPLSDYYGRRLIILIGVTTFTLGSIACCMVTNVTLLILAYSVVGIGSGAVNVTGYVIIKDIYSGSEYSKAISKLNMIGSIFSSIVAPITGGCIISYGYNWKFLFIGISFVASVMLTLIYFELQETLIVKKNKINVKEFILQYGSLLQNYRFLGFAAIQGLTSMWMWAYIANYTFIFKSIGIEARYYGYLIAAISLFYVSGTLINRKYVSRIGVSKMLIIGLTLPIVSCGSLIYFYFMNKLNIYTVEAALAINNVSIALIISNNITSALETIKDTGLGNAFISFCNLILGSIGTYIVGRFDGILPNLLLTVICSIAAICIYSTLRHVDKISK